MASPVNQNNQEVIRRQNKGPPFKFLAPLVYAPVLPLIRLSLRHRPVLRDRLFTAVLVGAFAHGFYLVYPSATSFSMLLKAYISQALHFYSQHCTFLFLVYRSCSQVSPYFIIGSDDLKNYWTTQISLQLQCSSLIKSSMAHSVIFTYLEKVN